MIKPGTIGRISAFFIACALSFQSLGAILFDGRFESGVIYPLTNGDTDSGFYGAMSQGCTLSNSVPNNRNYSITNDNRLVTSPVRNGTHANAQTVWRNCDYRSYNGGLQKPRQEFGVLADSFPVMGRPSGAKGLANNVEYWMGFSFYIPSDFVDDPTLNPTSLFQLKKYDSDTCCFFDLTFKGANIEARLKYLYNADGSALDSSNTTTWTATKNTWHDIVVNFKACTQAEKAGGCVPFFKLYKNENGATSDTVFWEKSGNANTNTLTGIDGPKLNVYKYAYNCTSALQANFTACTANPNPTNNPVKVTVYFDELLIGDSASSLAEIQPFVFDTPVDPGDEIAVIGHNANDALANSDDPVYYTTSGSTTQLGVRSVKVCRSGSATECDDMPAVNSNVTGGRYTANAFPNIIGDGNIPVTVTWTYDNDAAHKIIDSEAGPAITTTGGGSNWAGYLINTPPAAVARDVVTDYGYVNGGEICNSGADAGYHNSPSFSVVSGDVFEVRTTLDSGLGDSAKVQFNCTTAGTTNFLGTLGSLELGTQNAGSGITFDEESHSGVFSQVLKLTYNDNATDTCRLRIGPNTTTAGQCVKALGARIWKNPTSNTMTFDTTLARTDITAPSPNYCQISSIDTTTFNLGCLLDDSTGTFYSVISTSTTAPSLAQVKAGQDHTGAAALWSGSQAATSGTFTTGALNPYVQKCAYFAQTDGGGNDSALVSGESCVAAEETPTETKKFVWSTANGHAIECYNAATNTLTPYNDNMSIKITDGDYFEPNSVVTELAYAPVVDFTNGEATLLESDLTFGSINALLTGSQGYNYWATNGTCRVDNAIQLTVE